MGRDVQAGAVFPQSKDKLCTDFHECQTAGQSTLPSQHPRSIAEMQWKLCQKPERHLKPLIFTSLFLIITYASAIVPLVYSSTRCLSCCSSAGNSCPAKPFLSSIFTFPTISFLVFKLFSTSITAAYLILLNVAAFHRTLSGPACLPKRLPGEYDLETYTLEDGTVISFEVFQEARVIQCGARTAKIKLCAECLCFRGGDAAHCTACGHCVIEKDHHCWWLTVCVGRDNMESYLLFIGTLAVLCGCACVRWRELVTLQRCAAAVYVLQGVALFYAGVSLSMALLCVYYVFLCLRGEKSRRFIAGQGCGRMDVRRLRQLCIRRPPLGTAATAVFNMDTL